MGIHDRDYLRDESPQGVQLRPPQTAVVTIVLINAAVFVINLLLFSKTDWLMKNMACGVDSLINPLMWWQLLTAGFAHDPDTPWHILFNMFVFWSFGRVVEPVLGKREFTRFYLVALVFGSLLFCVRQLIFVGPDSTFECWGASGAVTAVTMLFIFMYPNSTIYLMMIIPVKAWVAGAFMIGVNVLGVRGVHGPGGGGIAYDVHLAGAAFAFFYFHFKWNLGRLVPGSLGRRLGNLARSLRSRPKLRVHTPDDVESDASYGKLDEEGDRILDKLHREGEESLTPEERRVLEDYSRRMRQKHR